VVANGVDERHAVCCGACCYGVLVVFLQSCSFGVSHVPGVVLGIRACGDAGLLKLGALRFGARVLGSSWVLGQAPGVPLLGLLLEWVGALRHPPGVPPPILSNPAGS
jgi:hypothetical protein